MTPGTYITKMQQSDEETICKCEHLQGLHRHKMNIGWCKVIDCGCAKFTFPTKDKSDSYYLAMESMSGR